MVCIYYLTVLLILNLRFESTVKTKGYQTYIFLKSQVSLFESTVKTKGYQTMMIFDYFAVLFESTVKTKGYQTAKILHCAGHKFESTVNLYTIKLEMELIAKAA